MFSNKGKTIILIFLFLVSPFCFNRISAASEGDFFDDTNLPNDEHYGYQWYLKKIKADNAWRIQKNASDIKVAVIDSGIDTDHPDLAGNIWHNGDEIPANGRDDDGNGYIDDTAGWDFIGDDNDPSPDFARNSTESGVSHGTIVAGVIGAVGGNGKGITGVSWDVDIIPLRALDDAGEGGAADIIRAIDYSVDNGAHIINLSFVGFDYNQGVRQAIQRAYKRGVITVAAAGNEKANGERNYLDKNPIYPVCYDEDGPDNMIIGVGATDPLSRIADFSAYGRCIDIMAPGVGMYSLSPYEPEVVVDGVRFDEYYRGFWSGTSMAVPVVSGSLALLEAVNPGIRADSIKKILFSGADNINSVNPSFIGGLGSGELNIHESLKNAFSSLKEIDLVMAPVSGNPPGENFKIISGKESNDLGDPYPGFSGGSYVATGDIDGDGSDEIITGAGYSGGPQVRIFDDHGNVRGQFFAYGENFRGGVHVATGDIDGDGSDEIITGAGYSGGPQVRIFDDHGNVRGQFFAYGENFRGGVHVATGDIDGDGSDEIITGAGYSGGPQVRIFDDHGNVRGQFFAYGENFRGGVRIAVGNVEVVDSRNTDEIITVPGPGGGPHIRIFGSDFAPINDFFAYEEGVRDGLWTATGDVNADGVEEIVVSPDKGSGPHIKSFDLNGKLIDSFYGYDKNFEGGVNIGIMVNR